MTSATGPSDARFETSAAYAEFETSNVKLQNEVEKNAAQARHVAEDAAKTANFKGPSTEFAVNNLEEGLAQKTDEAVADGKTSTAGYVQQAREIAGTAFATAASYLPSSISGPNTGGANGANAPTTQHSGSVMANLQSAAGTAVETAKSVYNTAQQTVQPHLETAKQTVQPHLETAKQTMQPHYDAAKAAIVGGTANDDTEAQTTTTREIPATTAPLQSGGGVIGGPYTKNGEQSTVASL